MSFPVKAFGAESAETCKTLKHLTVPRRLVGPSDTKIEILYCGICHSDIHTAYGEWTNEKGVSLTQYPCVPGHEIVGRVTEIGSDVTKAKVGDIVGVGCISGSCKKCDACEDDCEHLCAGLIGTYGGTEPVIGGPTHGGYSTETVVSQDVLIHIPKSMHNNLPAVAPLLCAGITTYSPLRRFGCGPSKAVGVVGLGGLGHMAVKLAKAMGAKVTVFTTSESKKADALQLGADNVILSKDKTQMASASRSFDIIVDTVSADHNINEYLFCLKREGSVVLVGAPPKPLSVSAFALLLHNVNLAGSNIGGIKQTQEMIDFCAEHQIYANIEMTDVDHINEAYERVLKSDIKYRFVIDIDSLRK